MRWLLLCSCVGGSGGPLVKNLDACTDFPGSNIAVTVEGAREHCGTIVDGFAELQTHGKTLYPTVELRFDGVTVNGEGILLLDGCPATGYIHVENHENGLITGRYTGFVNRECGQDNVDNVAVGAYFVDAPIP